MFGGRATYNQMLAVWFYGTLPLIFISVLTVVSLYAGMSGDSFNIRNTLGTNVGYYLQNSAPLWLVTLLSSVDIVAIWAAVLLTMGVSTVAGIKRGAAAAMVFGWWGIYGIILTPISLFWNLRGGKDLTPQVLATLKSDAVSDLLVAPEFEQFAVDSVSETQSPVDFLRQLEREDRRD